MKYKDLYAEIWSEREHKCSNCGIAIREPVVHNFSHIRSKGARPDLKYDKDNIEILCSSLNYFDRAGCHELSHTNPEKYKQRHYSVQ
jgi:hypothetical protein